MIDEMRHRRVSWPIPNTAGHPSCPLCGLSARRFRGDELAQLRKLEAHIALPHARCKACGHVTRPRHLARHRATSHRYPTMVIPGLENVA